MHPAVLRMIADTCRLAAAHGRWVGVCGGLASDPAALPILVGLGVTELSAVPGFVAEAKAIVRGLTVEAARGHAARSEEHTSELQSLMRISYAVFCLKKNTTTTPREQNATN